MMPAGPPPMMQVVVAWGWSWGCHRGMRVASAGWGVKRIPLRIPSGRGGRRHTSGLKPGFGVGCETRG